MLEFETGVAVEGVLIQIRGPNLGKEIRSATTDKKGRFKIPYVTDGTYEVKAMKHGMKGKLGTIIVSRKADKRQMIDLRLEVGT
jgi:hypothetical protein